MPHFYYQGVDRDGCPQRGRFWAAHEGLLRDELRAQGFQRVQVSGFLWSEWWRAHLPSRKQWIEEVVLFRHLLRAGMDLPQALGFLAQSPFWAGWQVFYREAVRSSPGGVGPLTGVLGRSCRRWPSLFSPEVCALLSVAEEKQQLPRALEVLAQQWTCELRCQRVKHILGLLLGGGWTGIALLLGEEGRLLWCLNSLIAGGVTFLFFQLPTGKRLWESFCLKGPRWLWPVRLRFYRLAALFFEWGHDPLSVLAFCQGMSRHAQWEKILQKAKEGLRQGSARAFMGLFPWRGPCWKSTCQELAVYEERKIQQDIFLIEKICLLIFISLLFVFFKR